MLDVVKLVSKVKVFRKSEEGMISINNCDFDGDSFLDKPSTSLKLYLDYTK